MPQRALRRPAAPCAALRPAPRSEGHNDTLKTPKQAQQADLLIAPATAQTSIKQINVLNTRRRLKRSLRTLPRRASLTIHVLFIGSVPSASHPWPATDAAAAAPAAAPTLTRAQKEPEQSSTHWE